MVLFSIEYGSVRIATISSSDLLLVGASDRTENVVVWPPFNAPSNSFVSSGVLEIVPLPCFASSALPVCQNTHVSSICIHFLMCGVSMLVGVTHRMWIPFDIAPSGNECRPVYFTFLTCCYLWVLSLQYLLFRVSSFFRLRPGLLLFPVSFFAYIVVAAARISS